jgi:hypothetical protein
LGRAPERERRAIVLMTHIVIYLSLLTAIAAILWWTAGTYSQRICGYLLKRLRDDTLNEPWSLFSVFSGETTNSREAEFINDSVSEKKVTRFLRLLLLLSYLLLACLILVSEPSWPNKRA